jgi:hypothetical protein
MNRTRLLRGLSSKNSEGNGTLMAHEFLKADNQKSGKHENKRTSITGNDARQPRKE